MVSILILCTGNSCRSQMAEGVLKNIDPCLKVFSAGTEPADVVHPFAVKVMKEIAIDLTGYWPKSVDEFIDKNFDYVVTVCDHANETCPYFSGTVKNRLHIGFNDPATATGTENDILHEFRTVRDEIIHSFQTFYQKTILA